MGSGVFFSGSTLPDADPACGQVESPSLNEAFSLAYEELRRLARTLRRNAPNVSLTPTVLVNEAWLKLAQAPGVQATSPLHFKRIAACAMRQILVDAARRRQTQSRGSGSQRVTFDDGTVFPNALASSDRELLVLDSALLDLSRLEPRQAALVEARFFGGLETAEVAQLLGISEATALRDWRAAKAWLAAEVKKQLK
jgi:RNA polymerase sigma factor (TIGR02999 family)